MGWDGRGPRAYAGILRTVKFVAVAVLLTLVFLHVVPHPPGIHYAQYRAAANLLMAGRSPYDVGEQARLQSSFQDGGHRPFLPYFYPPWLALGCAPLSFLPYRMAEGLYLFATCLFLVVAGSLLHDSAPGLSRWATIMVVVGFFPSLFAAQTSQISPLILLLAAGIWRSLDQRRDRSAGFALACITIKPQLSIGIVVGGLLWSARRGRMRVLGAFAVTLGLFCLASTAFDSSWPLEMLRAPSQIPLPTDAHPEIGVTWLLLLRTIGLSGWRLALGYGTIALPALAAIVGLAWDRNRSAGESIGMATISAFMISPYAQFYDFPVLLLPLWALMDHRGPSRSIYVLMLALLFLPYVNFVALLFPGWHPCSFAWVPATLAIAWLAKGRASRASIIEPRLNGDRIVGLESS